jgi:hypothetical protein
VHPYRQVLLNTSECTPKAFRVGRLVAMAFVPNPDPINKLFVDHIDGDSLNDKADNLRWVTASENMNNPITHERCKNNPNVFKKGYTPWNKNKKTGPMSEEGKKNVREGVKKYWDNYHKEHPKQEVVKQTKLIIWHRRKRHKVLGKYSSKKEAWLESGLPINFITLSIKNGKDYYPSRRSEYYSLYKQYYFTCEVR